MSRTNEYVNTIKDALSSVGVKIDEVRYTSHGHVKLKFRINGKERILVTGTSKSDWRAIHNHRSQIKRIIRESGLI